jgi:hypothetical protein
MGWFCTSLSFEDITAPACLMSVNFLHRGASALCRFTAPDRAARVANAYKELNY